MKEKFNKKTLLYISIFIITVFYFTNKNSSIVNKSKQNFQSEIKNIISSNYQKIIEDYKNINSKSNREINIFQKKPLNHLSLKVIDNEIRKIDMIIANEDYIERANNNSLSFQEKNNFTNLLLKRDYFYSEKINRFLEKGI